MEQVTEYTAYYALSDGSAKLISLFSDLSQDGAPGNCWAVNTTICRKLDQYKTEVDPYFKAALKKGGMTNGVCWIELMLDQDGHFYVIEMGYRMSGDMMAIPIAETTGFDSYKWLVDFSLNERHSISEINIKNENAIEPCGCAYVLWANESSGEVAQILGVDEILKQDGTNIEFDISEGSAYSSHQQMLTVTFTRDSIEEVIEFIALINNTIKVIGNNGQDVLLRFFDFDKLYTC